MYMIRCDCCGHWQHPEFDHNFIHLEGTIPDVRDLWDITEEQCEGIDLHNSFVMCEKCHKPLDLDNPDFRQWVCKHPSRSASRGYRINPFVNGNLDLAYIFKQLHSYVKLENRRAFFNTVLGTAYTDGTIQLAEEDIRACMTAQVHAADLSSFEDLWVGIDMGLICHITIGSSPENIVSAYQIHVEDIVQHVAELCKTNKVRGGCVDRHPYTPTANEIFRVSGGKIVPTEYRGTKDINIVLDASEQVEHAQVNRTSILDNFATKIRKRALRISGYGYQKEVFIEHLKAMARDESAEKPAEWVKLNPQDHFFHSSALMCIAPSVVKHIKLKLKDEVRTVVLGQVARMQDGTARMPGISHKRLDPVNLKR
jgi:hypothetical protein